MTSEKMPSFTLECDATVAEVASPRSCRLLSRISAPDRDDYWLAQVDPPFPGRYFGEGENEISKVVIATKLEGYSLFDRERNSIPVYVGRILNDSVVSECAMRPDQVEVMLWGAVRKQPDEALKR
jgi:hypothetical protein